MLPQKNRLTYQLFIKNPNSRRFYHSFHFDFLVKPSDLNSIRVVITVPKKLDKRSTARNRTKRIIQESLRNHLKNLNSNIDIMVKSKKILKKTDREIIEKELLILLEKAGVS